MIDVVVGEATATFIHTSNVNIACGEVAGDLDIAGEWSSARDLSGIRPVDTVVSRVANEEGAAANIKVVPGSVHPTVEGRRWVVISPARLSIILTVAVNAIEMGPAIRVPWSCGLVAAKALAAAATVQPNREPST